jgi:adenosylcobinamide-phosphate synthase
MRRRGGSWTLAGGIVAGIAADAVFGDPHRGHPVAVFGQAAQALQERIYADTRPRGAGYAAACVMLAAAPAWAAHQLTRRRPWARIAGALNDGDIEAARTALPALCGRDPSELTAADLARATIESVAESTSDGAVAPVVWGAVAGLPGLATYRAVNTLDSMVGYRSARYRRFGWASARLDDVLNWAPARLTGLLAVACAPVAGGSPAAAWRALRADGQRHPSPNAGQCEAAFAGALGIRLGGTNTYGGVTESRPELGTGRPPTPDDITRAIRLSRTITYAATAAAALFSVIAEAA